eukprot:TRINITY_DN4910_c1_g1_i4.p1 TRINITY_DN4910_c1_g1~~TRINITY_DN4910_c1_g1_i4.p1  ORF type:complete len:119 (-),score=17.76 TRINITY_DN4910_c1_g1_i4:105-461(-)
MRELYYRNGEGFVLVYSITDKRSFDELASLRKGIMLNQDDESQVCIVVAGNKCDLEDRRKVTHEDVEAQALAWGTPHLECSAREGTNITEIFQSLLQQKWNFTGGAPAALRRRACTLL